MALKKLVRDKIPAIIEKDTGERVITRILDDEEYVHELRWKLREEAREACDAGSVNELLEELADLEEVILALLKVHGLDRKHLEHFRTAKLCDRGGFDKRQFIVRTETRS